MKHLEINYQYSKGILYDEFYLKGEIHPSSYAMFWLMSGTGFRRIFSKEDMLEFLFRLPILLKSLGLVDKWFNNYELFEFVSDGKTNKFTFDDIVNHMGFQQVDSLESFCEREYYLTNITKLIQDSMTIGLFSNCSIIHPVKQSDGTYEISGKTHTPKITPTLLKNAELFANDCIRMIPEIIFEKTEAILLKEKEIEERKIAIQNLPVFDISKFPNDLVIQLSNMWFDDELLVDDYLTGNRSDFDLIVLPFIYLAWLWSKDLIEKDPFDEIAYPKEGVDLDYEFYELQDGGINLLGTYYEYDLEKAIDLIKKYDV